MLDKAIRELDRERLGLQNQDKKLITEIKKMAKANQMVCYRQPAAAAAVPASERSCLLTSASHRPCSISAAMPVRMPLFRSARTSLRGCKMC